MVRDSINIPFCLRNIINIVRVIMNEQWILGNNNNVFLYVVRDFIYRTG